MLYIYSAIPDVMGDDEWFNIGSAMPHRDKRGFELHLNVLPFGPKLMLREGRGERHAPSLPPSARSGGESGSLKRRLENYERIVIEHCLRRTEGRIDEAMKRLKLPRRTLSDRMRKLGIDRNHFLNGRSEKNGSADSGTDGRRHNARPEIEHVAQRMRAFEPMQEVTVGSAKRSNTKRTRKALRRRTSR